jgi:hypothetical protein
MNNLTTIFTKKYFYKYNSYKIALTTYTEGLDNNLWCDLHISLKNYCSLLISVDFSNSVALLEYIKSTKHLEDNLFIIELIKTSGQILNYFFPNILQIFLNNINAKIRSPDITKNWCEYYLDSYLLDKNLYNSYLNFKQNYYKPVSNNIIDDFPFLSDYDITSSENNIMFLSKLFIKNIDLYNKIVDDFVKKYIFNDIDYCIYLWIIDINTNNIDKNLLIELDYMRFNDYGNIIYKSRKHLSFNELCIRRLTNYKIIYY